MRRARTEGDIVEISLGNGRRAFGRLLYEPAVEFYDLECSGDSSPNLGQIRSSSVAFAVDVMNSAVTSGRWKRIGNIPLTDQERNTPLRSFKEDPHTSEFSIYWEDPLTGAAHEVAAEREEIELLERAAVWSAEHIEDRLRDHFAGRTSKWVEALRPSARS